MPDDVRGRRLSPILVLAALHAPAAAPAAAALPVVETRLANGVTLLVAPRPGLPLVAAAWAVRAGSADEAPGATGVAHLLEHALFHGTRTIASRGEFARVYTENGVSGINAYTQHDFTVFCALVPRERLELWFWMESDRLRAPVFRDLERELRVVAEERRQRVETTPTGALDERVAAAFWGEEPYGRPLSGLPADLARLDRAAAEAFFARHYRPENLVLALVGDVDPEAAGALLRRYFGRLRPARAVSESRPEEVPAASAAAPPPPARLALECDCAPRARLFYRTVPFSHPDRPALDVLAGVLNGRTGRLHRALVVERGLAFAAWSEHAPLRRAGSLLLEAEARGGTAPSDLAAALAAEVGRLRDQSVAAAELEKVKKQIVADGYRALREPLALALRLLAYEAAGDWRHLETWPRRAAAVAAADVARVARVYLGEGAATEVLYARRPRAGAGGE